VLDAVTNEFVSAPEIRTVRWPRPHTRRLMAGVPAPWRLLVGEGSLGKAALGDGERRAGLKRTGAVISWQQD
jgi:hypothetical protein